ncbi:phage terminase large subunit-like protein [Methylorubrum rhodinum]|uniref:Phage terminase large subunit-like protein n=1 Tax=Methylorubrum rhodinum TaxID=29428 RepID=A0A840ZL52_9HYPH|nr:terminase large subunit [Methylorubrum rhodinum]MBB5758842.1 phage terminase large subunit-like protein [Methylorubrum rhodinum]
MIPFKPLFPAAAQDALDVFKSLRVVDLPGQPTFGEVSEPWVFDWVAAIFGAYDADLGQQLIREFFLLISKKNTKSTLGAGIMLTALIINWRHEEEVLILAPTIEVAQNAYKPAAAMVRADPELDAAAGEGGFLHVQDHLKTITHLSTRAALKVVAADTDTVSGKKAGRILIDELWIFGKRPKADAMLREATGGLVSRPEGFVISLSTQSDEPPAGVFKAKLDYFRDVRDGKVVDPKSFGLIYEFPRAMIEAKAYLDPDNFYITNPNIDRSVSREWLEDELRKEEAKGEDTRRTFLAKHLNVEIGMGLRANRWPGAEFWERAAEPGGLTLEGLLDRSEVVCVGIDGGGLDDIFGIAVVGRDRVTRDWLAWTKAWAHKGVLERRKSIAARLRDFATARELTIVDDALEDISEIVAVAERVKEAGLLACVGVDPAGLGELIEAFAEVGITQDDKLLIGVSQGYGLMNAIKTAERKLASGTLRHSGSGLAAWCVSNLKIEPTATAIRATKQNAGDAKIDVAMALFNAVALMATNPDPAKPSDPSDFLREPLFA